MKITLDFSDNVRGAFINYVRKGDFGFVFCTCSLDSEDLYDGNVIKIPRDAESEG